MDLTRHGGPALQADRSRRPTAAARADRKALLADSKTLSRSRSAARAAMG